MDGLQKYSVFIVQWDGGWHYQLRGIITSIKTPDRYGNIEEITAGFPVLEKYLMGHPHFGVIVGRYANRIAMTLYRIGQGVFASHQQWPKPPARWPQRLSHQGVGDELVSVGNKGVLKLTHHSPDGEEGYPGNLKVTVEYSITDTNEIALLTMPQLMLKPM